jgi:hypothetical protein
VQHLAGVGAGGQQRVVAELTGGAVGRATLVVAVDLADGGVQVDGQRRLTGPGARRPRPAHDGLGDPVQLPDVPEGERAQERTDGRGGHDLVAEDLGGGPGAQHVGVVDAVGSGEDRVDQRQHLRAGPVGAGPAAEVDLLVDHLLDPSRWASVAGSSSPALATAWSSSKPTTRALELCEDGIENVPS